MILTKKELIDMQIGELKDEGDFMIKRVYGGWIYYDKTAGIAVYVPQVLYTHTTVEDSYL